MKSLTWRVKQGQVHGETPEALARRFHEAVGQPDAALVMFFCSAEHDPVQVVDALQARFGATPLVGGWTVGEIGPDGSRTGSLAGASLPARHFRSAVVSLDPAAPAALATAQDEVRQALLGLEQGQGPCTASNTFGFLMVDGVSEHEEPVTRALQAALGDVPLIGGTVGNTPRFERTWVYGQGRLMVNAAVLTLLRTDLPLLPVMTQHFEPLPQRLVVTGANARQRLVHEIDGRPATLAYADALGVPVQALDEAVFAATPLAVLIGGTSFIRSVSRALPDGSLKFYGAVDEGMVLHVMRPNDLVGNLRRALDSVRARLGPPELVLGCECFLRRTLADRSGEQAQLDALMREHRVLGYLSFGEQYRGVHVNQTFCALAIGAPPDDGHD